MKKIIVSVLFFSLMSVFAGCSGDAKQENTDGNSTDSTSTNVQADPNARKVETGDAQGEDEEVASASAAVKKDDSFVNFKANEIGINCTFASNSNMNATTFQRKNDDSYSMIVFERGTTEQMREKLSLNIINYNPRTLKFPYEIKPEAGKHFQVNYHVKKSGIYITYFANAKDNGDKFKITLTDYENGILKGTFEGEVKNTAGKIIKLEEGKFEIKFEEQVLDAQNPA